MADEKEVQKTFSQSDIDDAVALVKAQQTRYQIAKFIILMFGIFAFVMMGFEGVFIYMGILQGWSAGVISIISTFTGIVGLIVGSFYEAKKQEDKNA